MPKAANATLASLRAFTSIDPDCQVKNTICGNGETAGILPAQGLNGGSAGVPAGRRRFGDAGVADTALEFAAFGCYIGGMLIGRGWMLRITGPILG